MGICAYGAGAIGGYLTKGLAEVHGPDVPTLARGARLQAIRERGLICQLGRNQGPCPTILGTATDAKQVA